MKRLIICSLLLTSGCASMTNQQKRILTTVIGGSLGATAGNLRSDQSAGADRKSTVYLSSAVGMGVGYGLGEWLFPDENQAKLDEALAQNDKLRRGQIDGLLEDKNRDDVLRLNLPDQNNCPGDLRLQVICPDENGNIAPCDRKIGYTYVNRNWAIKWVAFRSVDNCFIPPYKALPSLERFSNELDRSLGR